MSSAMESPRVTEVKIPRPIGILLFVIPIVGVLLGWLATRSPGPDPTVNFFKKWLNADPATNPVAYHAPFRDDGSLVYVSTSETEVRAVMDGTISDVHDHFVELSATNRDGTSVIVSYSGLSVTAHHGESLKCGAKVGSMDRFLQVRFVVGGKLRLPPESLLPLPRALQGFPENPHNRSDVK